MIYCDTSFLLPVYLERESFHPLAARFAAGFTEPMALTLLLELELHNGVRRNLAGKSLSLAEHDAIFRQVAADESEGILERCFLRETEHFGKARELSRKYTPTLSSRSLDILHIAAAQLLRLTRFASFDVKQRALAKEVGFQLVPPNFPTN